MRSNAAGAGVTSSIPGSGRSPGGGHGNALQYSCLEKPMDRGAWHAIVLACRVGHDLATEHACIYQHRRTDTGAHTHLQGPRGSSSSPSCFGTREFTSPQLRLRDSRIRIIPAETPAPQEIQKMPTLTCLDS